MVQCHTLAKGIHALLESCMCLGPENSWSACEHPRVVGDFWGVEIGQGP